MASRKDRIIWTGVLAVVGFLLGLMAAPGAGRHLRREPQFYPLPHHVPKHPGGASFRFAMVHDVLHERYPKHGPAHYTERNRLTRESLSNFAPDDLAAFRLTDDLAAGLARLGRLDEAVELLRAKLARQEAQGLTGRDLYTSYANLGAILFHARLDKARAGDPAARKEAEEGVALIKKAVAVNPESHFGREEWQVAYAEFLLAAIDKPEVLRKYDFIGQHLDEYVDGKRGNAVEYSGYSAFGIGHISELQNPERITNQAIIKTIRNQIKGVGRTDFAGPTDLNRPRRVAFDEPCLGVVGMWRQGIGADPHFALCLGETMLRVGQRFIAWTAFERAARMADRFGPSPDAQRLFGEHCRQRQREIETTLSNQDRADLRPRFDAELAYGERYQREYQEYEARKIAAGEPIDGSHFYDEFHAGREPIASPSGPEEWYATRGDANTLMMDRVRRTFEAACWGLLGAGVAAAAAVWFFRRRAARAALASVAREG